MEKEKLKIIFEFLEDKEGYKTPFIWKLLNNIQLTKEELIVKGDLGLADTDITSLPEGLHIFGDLLLPFTEINILPKGLKVERNMLIFLAPKLEVYTDEELREMIKPDGFIKGEIVR